MALVLVRDLNGKGNYDTAKGRLCPAKSVPDESGRKRQVRTGGDAWQPEFGKGSLLVFKPWEAVVCTSGRSQEDAVLDYVNGIWPDNQPVKRLDFTGRENRDVMLEYLRRHPEIAPSAAPGTAEYTLQMMELVDHFTARDAAQGKPRFIPMKFDATPAELEAQAAALKAASSPTPQGGRKFGAEGGESSMAKGAELDASSAKREAGYSQAVYDGEYARHRAEGKSEAQAATYAERSRQAAMRRETTTEGESAPAA